MADWPRLREWYLRWGKASNSEWLVAVWRRHRGLTTELGVVLRRIWQEYRAWIIAGVVFAGVVALAGGWLLKHSEEIRNLMLSVGVGAAIFGGWVAYQRSQTDRMRVDTDRLRQVTDSFAKAVELLAHDDRSVRLGAIYALERIARQNRDEHWPIMETLTAYVRERSAPMNRPDEAEGVPPSDEPTLPAPLDIKAVFTVLGRRMVEHERGARGRMRRLNLTGAYLVKAEPDHPPGRAFDGVVLIGADLREAYLERASLRGANLAGANLEGADLSRADLEWAWSKGANFEGAWFLKAKLGRANLEGADLSGADLAGADLSTAKGLTQEQLNSAEGDKDTKIPEGLTRPEHWL
jgi:hypothetical protein